MRLTLLNTGSLKRWSNIALKSLENSSWWSSSNTSMFMTSERPDSFNSLSPKE